MESRPELTKSISVKDFKEFYWYKEELLEFCRTEGLNKHGGKLELATRIETYLATGNKGLKSKSEPIPKSTFDWNNEELTLKTVITDNYKNTENVRAFFQNQLGNKFKFNVKFMNWMKEAEGKTLGEAIAKWLEIKEKIKSDKSPKNISPQFEYNTYIRDFVKDNPDMPRSAAIDCWKVKKTIRGDNKYKQTDLEFLKAY